MGITVVVSRERGAFISVALIQAIGDRSFDVGYLLEELPVSVITVVRG